MILIGLTGGIGSGKTAASDHFAKLGAPIVDTDIIAREILQQKPNLLNRLTDAFGPTILNKDGSLDRSELRKRAFADKDSKQRLDNIMHPAIRQQTLQQIDLHREADYCIVVVPLLIETDFKQLVDRILVVTAPLNKRLSWLQQRSGLSHDEAQAIIDAQTSDEERLSYAHDHVNNNRDLKHLYSQVKKLHHQYQSISQ
ncbi:MAG: dephospho-CoA kinase [Arenicella sp.]